MIYRELFKAIVLHLLMKFGKAASKAAENKSYASEIPQEHFISLSNPEDRASALQVLRLATFAQSKYINSLTTSRGQQADHDQVIQFMNTVDNAFETKKPSGQIDNFIEEWMNSVVLSYVGTLAPVWLMPLLMMAKGGSDYRPTLTKLLFEYVDPSILTATSLAGWTGLNDTVNKYSHLTFESIRESLINNKQLLSYSADLAKRSIDANHYLPFRMLTNWLKYEKNLDTTVNSLDSPSKFVSLTPLDSGYHQQYLRQPISPIAEPKNDWREIKAERERRKRVAE